MQLHFENTAENYFANRLSRLRQNVGPSRQIDNRLSFVDLKINEFWVRFLRTYKNGNSKKFLDVYKQEKYIRLIADNLFEKNSVVKYPNFVKTEIAGKSYTSSELVDAYHESRDFCYARGLFTIFSCYPTTDPIIQKVLSDAAIQCALDNIDKGCRADDMSLKCAFELKRIFHLSDEALDLILYLWLKNHQNMNFCLEVSSSEPNNCFDPNHKGSLSRISEITGLDASAIHSFCSKDGALMKFRLIKTEEAFRNVDNKIKRKELYLSEDIEDFLYGFSNVKQILDFSESKSPVVSYEEIAKLNTRASFVLNILENCPARTPLNILFYGKEGTGKTELARSLAQKLNLPLLEVGYGDESMNEESRLQGRLRSLLLADWECQKRPGIILMDEADLVLNNAEKGYLNIVFENLKTPVIWITNSIRSIENSTRRRFDYSLEFSTFGKRERVAIWNSVLKSRDAETMMTDADINRIAEEIPVMAGSATLAVLQAQRMQKAKMAPVQVVREIAQSHAKLLGIQPTIQAEVQTNYNVDYVHLSDDGKNSFDYLIPMLQNFDKQWRYAKVSGKHENLNMLLYGPPGTGKSAFAQHVVRDILHRDILMKRASDILGGVVGETERNIREIFREAELSEAVLFIDEADSFFEARGDAKHQWEVTQVNEFICQMDAFNGMLIAATNFENTLDWAIRRRFQVKLAFQYMDTEQISKTWADFFGGMCPKPLLAYDNIAISDFQSVKHKLHYVPEEMKTSDFVLQNMLEEIMNKDSHRGRRLGL